MGQKVHPLGFRLGVNKNYRSKWFTRLGSYSSLLLEDYFLRKTIFSYFDNFNTSKNNKNLLDSINITDIAISRKFDQIDVSISIASANSLVTSNSSSDLLTNLKSNHIIDNLRQLLTKQLIYLNTNGLKRPSRIILNIKESSNIHSNAVFIAKCLIDDLEKRVPFRRALKGVVDVVQKQQNIAGLKIKISGRLNGIEMARSEWIREGRIPLQTIIADMQYCSDVAHTKYGLLGIKIWVYSGKNCK